MSIAIRTYEGDSQSLSQFVVNTWLSSYREQMSVPDWTAEYFDWQMTGPDYTDRELLLTAWKGDCLVGSMLAMPFDLWINGREYQGAHGSWLAVAPQVRRDGVGLMLSNEMNRRQLERNYYGRLGYSYQGARQSLGPRFWRSGRTNTNFVRRMYLWARVLNAKAVSRWTNKLSEKFALSLLPQFVYGIGKADRNVSVRDYEPDDLPACLDLINKQAKKTDLAVLWSEGRLKKQLSYPDLAETLIVEQQGNVIGFLNFHLLGLFLHGRITSAVIDLFACENLNNKQAYALLAESLRKMKSLNVDLVLMREFAAQPKIALLKSRFIPQIPDSYLMINGAHGHSFPELTKNRKMQILWR